jgi:putative FmdB family regulatory protein
MPIYEYRCESCGHEFEQLIRTGDTPACPSCKGQTLARLLSHVSMSSENTRQLNFNKARSAAKLVQRDKERPYDFRASGVTRDKPSRYSNALCAVMSGCSGVIET